MDVRPGHAAEDPGAPLTHDPVLPPLLRRALQLHDVRRRLVNITTFEQSFLSAESNIQKLPPPLFLLFVDNLISKRSVWYPP